jgi:hypothetical protein
MAVKKNFKKVITGSISHGTMLESDLIPTLVHELEYLNNNKHTYKAIINEGKKIIEKDKYETDKTSVYLNETLFNALNELAPTGFYFGSNEGDGSDFGFWLDSYFVQDFDGLKVSDLSKIPENYSGEVIHVNDHGNTTLYVAKKGKLEEIWGIV